MRVFAYSLIIGLSVFFFVAGDAYAQIVPKCGGGQSGIGSSCRACDLVALGQNLMTWLIGISIFIAMVIIAFVGLKMVTTGGSSELLKDTAASLVGGIIILLAAWLIIDTVMKFLVDGEFGPWNTIECMANPTFERPPEPNWAAEDVAGSEGAAAAYTGNCAPVSSGPCSEENLRAAGFGNDARTMSVICGRESGGANPSLDPNRNTDVLWHGGQIFSHGMFQINLVANSISCNGETLNCPQAFTLVDTSCRQASWGQACGRAGYGYQLRSDPASQELYNKCVAAARNYDCNIARAKSLYDYYKSRGANPLQPWTTSQKKCGV